MRFALLTSAALSAGSVLVGSQARAAVLPVASYLSGTTAIGYDRTLLTASSRGTETATAFQVGESAVDTNDYRAYIPFALSTQDVADALSTGSTIKLFVNLGVASNASGSTMSLVGLTGRGATTTGGAASAGIVGSTADYSTAPSTVIQSGIAVAQTGYTLDVTAYVKAQVAANAAIAFRIQGDNVAKGDGLLNQLSFSSADNATVANRPTLTITTVPEPTTLAALAAGTLLLRRRRASNG